LVSERGGLGEFGRRKRKKDKSKKKRSLYLGGEGKKKRRLAPAKGRRVLDLLDKEWMLGVEEEKLSPKKDLDAGKIRANAHRLKEYLDREKEGKRGVKKNRVHRSLFKKAQGLMKRALLFGGEGGTNFPEKEKRLFGKKIPPSGGGRAERKGGRNVLGKRD